MVSIDGSVDEWTTGQAISLKEAKLVNATASTLEFLNNSSFVVANDEQFALAA